MSFATEMQAVALELITEFGEAVSFARVVEGTYNTSTSTTAAGTSTSFTGVCVPLEYTAAELSTKDVLSQDFKLIVNKTATEPKVGDVATVNSVAYRVMDVTKGVITGQDIYYELQVRV